MPAVKRITMSPFVDDVEYLIVDASADVKRKYKPAVMTRSRKRAVLEMYTALAGLEADNAERDGLPTLEQEAEGIRLACDLLNELLATSTADAPKAGDVLYADWEKDLTPESAISEVLAKALGIVEDEPNPTQTGA